MSMFVDEKKPFRKLIKEALSLLYKALKEAPQKLLERIKKTKRPLMWISLTVVGFFMLTAHIVERNIDFPRQSASEVTFVGKVKDIEYKNDKRYLYLSGVEVVEDERNMEGADGQKEKAGIDGPLGTVAITENVTEELHIGSHVLIRGKVNIAEKATNPGQFDARHYYISKGYLYTAYSCEILAKDGKINYIKEFFYQIKMYLSRRIDNALDENDAGILKALFLADKTGMDSKIKNLYKDAGTSHLLAISGMHISLLAGALLFIFKRLPINVKAAYILTIVCLFFYGAVIGYPPSAFRAIIMFSVMTAGKILRRSYDTLTALALAALISIVLNPLSVLQTGFLMSYLAIIGLALVSAIFDVFEDKKNIPAMMTSSLSVTLTTLPVVLRTSYKISLFAPLVNLVLIPGMSAVLLVGVLCIVTQCFLDLFRIDFINIFSILIHLILKLYEILMTLELKLPFSLITTGCPAMSKCIIYMLVLLTLAFIVNLLNLKSFRKGKRLNNYSIRHPQVNIAPALDVLKEKKKKQVLIAFLIVFANVVFLIATVKTNKIEFVDIGQGLFACVQYNGHVYCFDCGSSDKNKIADNIVKPYLAYYAINKVDAWFISHDDADHVNGLYDLLDSNDIKIENIVISKPLETKMTDLIHKVESKNINVIMADEGDVFSTGSYPCFTVLSPGRTLGEDLDSNKLSLVVLMETKENNVLFMADADSYAEEKVVHYLTKSPNAPDHIDILQSAHHGSGLNTNNLDFLMAVKPKVTVISCGFNNRYKHPFDSTLENLSECGSKLYRTDYDGCVGIRIK